MSTGQQIEVGDVVECTKTHDGIRKGSRFVVEFYSEGFKPGDPEYGDEAYLQGPIAEGRVGHGYQEVEAKYLEVVTKAVDVKEPTVDQVASSLRLDGYDEGFEEHESGPEGPGGRYFAFTDEHGQEWTAVVRVTHIQKEI